MGTRHLTHVKDDEGRTLVTMYGQYDGYPEGHGKELSAFLKKITMVNGLRGDRTNIANGMECLAAQIVSHFKNEAGGFYLYPPDTEGVGEEYTYIVSRDNLKIIGSYTGVIYDGPWVPVKHKTVLAFCNSVRNELGLPPVDKMEKGAIYHNTPIAQTITKGTDFTVHLTELFVYVFSDKEMLLSRTLPDKVTRFQKAFQEGKHPDLVK